LKIFLQHGTQHIEAAREDPDFMKQHGTQIAQFANKIATTQRQLAQAEQAQAQAAGAMQNLRGITPGAAPEPECLT
jgi:4-hydroxyphenylpyruvate dioxygenase-like putative hemolysin